MVPVKAECSRLPLGWPTTRRNRGPNGKSRAGHTAAWRRHGHDAGGVPIGEPKWRWSIAFLVGPEKPSTGPPKGT